MYRRSIDLLIVAPMALAGMATALSGANSQALGLLFGLPLALALPGYALIAAGAPGSSLGPAERLAFSVGGSIAIGVLGGLALNGTAWGLQPASWALLLGGTTLVACAIAYIRRRGNPATQAPSQAQLRPRDAGLFGLAALIAVVAFALAIDGAAQPPGEGFTQLWMLPDGANLRLGAQNVENQPTQYTIELAIGKRIVRRWETVELENGARWEAVEPLPAHTAGATLELRLYRLDDPKMVYRRVMLHGDSRLEIGD